LLEVVTQDRAGLLYGHGIGAGAGWTATLRSRLIDTEGQKAIDVFFI